MRGFLRPEVEAAFWRWREAILGAAVLALGLRWALTAFGALFLLGCALAAAGVALIAAGIPRARFRGAGGGAGLVEVDERRITYFGPLTGGEMAVEEIRRLDVRPARHWVLTGAGGAELAIPMDAEGAEALFDAFAALPGLSAARLAEAAGAGPADGTTVWARPHSGVG